VGGNTLPIVFHIAAKDGALSATWDSPSQGAFGLATKSVTLMGSDLAIDIPLVQGSYTGRVSDDASLITGRWSQGGASLALDLGRAAVAGPKRPQTPLGPFPYASLEVAIPGGGPGVTLAGTLTLPAGKGPFPALVIVSGSGPQDRNETIFGHKPFLVIADYLARRGIAALRYDDRGFGASTGSFDTATTMDFADDAQAALAWLAARKEIDPSRLGIAGHSEGGLIAPIVASRDPRVGFAILLAGPGLPGEQILYLQGAAIARAGGISEAEIARATAINARIYAAAMAPGSDSEAAARAKAVYLEAMTKAEGLDDKARQEAIAQADSLARQIASPWMRAFLALDPRTYLAKVAVPTLALNGGLDLQVPPAEDIEAITKAFAGSGHGALLTTRVLPGLNHLFQHGKTGSPAEYGVIEETFAPEALQAIADWILALPGRP
jgi:pimeloyl-ACP methyl ester carboxylesterase